MPITTQPPTKELIHAPTFLPDSHCVICCKTIDDVGGRRITAQQVRGVALSNKYRGGGNAKFPYKSFRFGSTGLFLRVWGEVSMWTEEAIQRALKSFYKGKRPWFCQLCGNRICPECGSPLRHPVGSDVLGDDGSSVHVGMLPCSPGCINPKCKKHRDINRG